MDTAPADPGRARIAEAPVGVGPNRLKLAPSQIQDDFPARHAALRRRGDGAADPLLAELPEGDLRLRAIGAPGRAGPCTAAAARLAIRCPARARARATGGPRSA